MAEDVRGVENRFDDNEKEPELEDVSGLLWVR